MEVKDTTAIKMKRKTLRAARKEYEDRDQQIEGHKYNNGGF